MPTTNLHTNLWLIVIGFTCNKICEYGYFHSYPNQLNKQTCIKGTRSNHWNEVNLLSRQGSCFDANSTDPWFWLFELWHFYILQEQQIFILEFFYFEVKLFRNKIWNIYYSKKTCLLGFKQPLNMIHKILCTHKKSCYSRISSAWILLFLRITWDLSNSFRAHMKRGETIAQQKCKLLFNGWSWRKNVDLQKYSRD